MSSVTLLELSPIGKGHSVMPDYNITDGETYSLGLDSASYIGGAAVFNSIYSTICRYVTDGGTSLPQKLLTYPEARTYLLNNIALVSNFESTGKVGNGYSTGYQDAYVAIANHNNAGGPHNATIYFSIDYDAAESEQPIINDYFKGVYDYFAGEYEVGVYGGYWICKRLRDKYPNIKVWQTLAWSGGQVLDNIEMLQRTGEIEIYGSRCDVNEIRKPGRIGAWQDTMDGDTPLNSLVDNKPYTIDQYITFIDLHTYNTDLAVRALTTALQTLTDKLEKVIGK